MGEAGVKRGDSVRVNRCNGEPSQKWTWIPAGHGRSTIQLKDTNECLDATPGGNSVWLRPCEEQVAESWKLEEALPVPEAGNANVMMSLLAMASVAALSMGAWFWRRHGKMLAVSQQGKSCSGELKDIVAIPTSKRT